MFSKHEPKENSGNYDNINRLLREAQQQYEEAMIWQHFPEQIFS
jgi:hypothetical protein